MSDEHAPIGSPRAQLRHGASAHVSGVSPSEQYSPGSLRPDASASSSPPDRPTGPARLAGFFPLLLLWRCM